MRRSLPQATLAATDLVGTLLLVVVVVALGSVLAVVVAATLNAPSPTVGAYALAPVAPGDASLAVRYQNGGPMDLTELKLLLSRNATGFQEIPRAAWTTPDAKVLRAGDALRFALSPSAARDETLRVTLVHASANAVVADLSQRASAGGATLGAATLSASLAPGTLAADGVSPTLVEARVSHPLGALAIASVQADLSPIYAAAGASGLVVDLNDLGLDGDAQGGDGVWSAIVRAPASTPVGAYAIAINATDAAGARAGATSASVIVEPPLHGKRAGEGTRFVVPASSSMTALRLRNWTYDALHPDRADDDAVLVRISNATRSWSAHVTIELCSGVPCATQLRAWSDGAETTYVPVGTQLLSSLDLNLLDPAGSGAWTRASGSANPLALYPSAGVGANATFTIVAMRDTTSPASADKAYETGLYAVDLVVR